MAGNRETLDWDETPGERRGDYQTVGGFVLVSTRCSPTFPWGVWRIEVLDMKATAWTRCSWRGTKASDKG